MTVADSPPSLDLMDLSTFLASGENEVFDRLRSTEPVRWNAPSDHGPGFWALTRYEDVKAAASDHERLSSASGTQIMDRKVEGALASLHNMDDPEHAQLRKIVVPHVRAIKIKQWQDVIDESVDLLLEEAIERGSFDMVDLISARLPMLVLSRVLGVPAEDAPRLVDWTNRLTSSDPDHKVDESSLAQARDELLGYFGQLAEQRRAAPETDIVSILVNGQKDGRPLTEAELGAYYIVLVAAGNETTRHLTSGGTLALHDNPEARSRIFADQALVAPAVEEMFRFVSPVQSMRRTALVDHSIGDASVAKGDKVVLWFSSANRDPEVFTDPHEFQIDRTPNDHLSFGWGIHFCLGAHLARAEMRTFFGEVAKRRLRFDVVGEPERLGHNLFRGWTKMPVSVSSTRSGN